MRTSVQRIRWKPGTHHTESKLTPGAYHIESKLAPGAYHTESKLTPGAIILRASWRQVHIKYREQADNRCTSVQRASWHQVHISTERKLAPGVNHKESKLAPGAIIQRVNWHQMHISTES